jgi:hypothetical protein
LTSVFKGGAHRQAELFSWMISMLGEIGNTESIEKLRVWTGSRKHGKRAIQSIEEIERRMAARLTA